MTRPDERSRQIAKAVTELADFIWQQVPMQDVDNPGKLLWSPTVGTAFLDGLFREIEKVEVLLALKAGWMVPVEAAFRGQNRRRDTDDVFTAILGEWPANVRKPLGALLMTLFAIEKSWRVAVEPFPSLYWKRLRELGETLGAEGRKPPVRRRRRAGLVPKPLTAKQTETVQVVGECKGDLAEAARRLGIDRKTVKQHYDAASRKLGKIAVKHTTQPLRTDRRGQANVAQEDDRRR